MKKGSGVANFTFSTVLRYLVVSEFVGFHDSPYSSLAASNYPFCSKMMF